MAKSMWTPARQTSHSQIMGYNKWSWSPLCCNDSLHSSGTAFHEMLEHCCGDLFPFSHKSIREVGQRCWVIRSGLQLVFQFITKVFDGVEARALCRPVKFLHTDRQTISVWTSLCAREHCHGERGKGLPQTVATKLEEQNHLECHCMLLH